MKIESTSFRDLMIITPDVFGDDRGYFFEPFNEARFRVETGLNITFVQDNESLSRKNVLRGLHFQVPPKSQAKLIRVTRGAVLDVVVDLRKSEPTFGKHFSIVLSSESKQQLYVPEGFAHGFYVLEDQTIIFPTNAVTTIVRNMIAPSFGMTQLLLLIGMPHFPSFQIRTRMQ
jgi:dTDP-4-dehydrorhamnose 3,5-epimerase